MRIQLISLRSNLITRSDDEFVGMLYVKGASFISELACLSGTRQSTIDEIFAWATSRDKTTSRIFWLRGVAGSGKSAIAHAIARQFAGFNGLASSFCFNVSDQIRRRSDHLFGTISLDFALFDQSGRWKAALSKALDANSGLRETASIEWQYEMFVLGPAAALEDDEVALIVIDALDESGDPSSRKALLSVLRRAASELPPNIRILVTSRAEHDIVDALDGKEGITQRTMESIGRAETDRDIKVFIESKLSSLFERQPQGQQWIQDLVDKSEGLFQWASTACKFIRPDDDYGVFWKDQLEAVLASEPSSSSALYSLYRTVLNSLFRTRDERFLRRFQLVMGRMLAVVEPLSMTALGDLVDLE